MARNRGDETVDRDIVAAEAQAGETPAVPVAPTETALQQAERVIDGIRAYGDVRRWRTNLTPDVAETLGKAEEYAKVNPDSTPENSAQVRLAQTAADLDKRDAAWLKGYQALQEAIEAQQKADG